jgi:small subunit ribosomal protein S2
MSELDRAVEYLRRVASNESLVLWIATKSESSDLVMREAQRCEMPYVNERWVPGTLTNFGNIRKLDGIRDMNQLPECRLVIVDPTREHNAVREAKRMGITTVALIDTNGDGELAEVDLSIACTDSSLEHVMTRIADAILDGRQGGRGKR